MNTFAVDDHGTTLRFLDLPGDDDRHGALVFIHGLGCASSSDYAPVVASREYGSRRSLLIDLPGAGFSDRPDDADYASDAQAALLARFIDAMHLPEVSLFGHSAGAFIVLKLAQRLPARIDTLILCEPGLTDYGIAMLSTIASMSEQAFVDGGFAGFLAQLKAQGTNDAWLGPFSVAAPRAIWQWTRASLDDNASDWMHALAQLDMRKGIVLSGKATRDDIVRFERAGCVVEQVANAEHMIAYDDPDGLARAIDRLLPRAK